MEIQSVEDRPGASFRRLTGVRKRTFHEMVFVLYTAEVCRKEREEAESSGRGNTAPDDVGILARIPHICPYRLELRGQREHRLQQHPLVRGYAHQEQGVHTSRQERPAPQRPAVRERPHRRDRNARGATSKKAAPPLFGQEKTPHPEGAARRGEDHRHNYLRRPCGWPPAGLPAVQAITGQAPSRHRVHGPTETAWQDHDAEKMQQKESPEQG